METPYVLYRQVFANATDNYVWQCSRCSSKNPGREPQLYIPKEWVARQMAEQDMERLPSLMPGLYDRCARCGNRGTESHHWAPVGIFGRDEADKWPRDYLCKDCHDQWHKLVTPQLVVTDGRLL
jgi:hypothetical protein